MIKIIKNLSEYSEEYENILVTAIDIEDEEKKEFNVKLTRQEYELVTMLNQIQSGAGLYAPTMNELWDRIQSFGRTKYKQGLGDCKEVNEL